MSTTVQGRRCVSCGYYSRENKNRGWCYWLGTYRVGYIAQVPDIKDELESMALKLQALVDKMCYVEPLLLPAKPECPQYIERLHPYKKHESHGKPNYWPRIRSNPRQR